MYPYQLAGLHKIAGLKGGGKFPGNLPIPSQITGRDWQYFQESLLKNFPETQETRFWNGPVLTEI